MNIILGQPTAESLSDRYILLPLDTFIIKGAPEPVPSYCVIENVPISELPQMQNYRDLHVKLMENYGRQNWNYCEQAIEHLLGKWNGELDSFYADLLARVGQHRSVPPGANWQPAIAR